MRGRIFESLHVEINLPEYHFYHALRVRLIVLVRLSRKPSVIFEFIILKEKSSDKFFTNSFQKF